MIYRKPTVIHIKAQEDMQDVQPNVKQGIQLTPNNQLKGKLQDLRNQMEVQRNFQSQSPYSSELFNQLLSNIRDEVNDDI